MYKPRGSSLNKQEAKNAPRMSTLLNELDDLMTNITPSPTTSQPLNHNQQSQLKKSSSNPQFQTRQPTTDPRQFENNIGRSIPPTTRSRPDEDHSHRSKSPALTASSFGTSLNTYSTRDNEYIPPVPEQQTDKWGYPVNTLPRSISGNLESHNHSQLKYANTRGESSNFSNNGSNSQARMRSKSEIPSPTKPSFQDYPPIPTNTSSSSSSSSSSQPMKPSSSSFSSHSKPTSHSQQPDHPQTLMTATIAQKVADMISKIGDITNTGPNTSGLSQPANKHDLRVLTFLVEMTLSDSRDYLIVPTDAYQKLKTDHKEFRNELKSLMVQVHKYLDATNLSEKDTKKLDVLIAKMWSIVGRMYEVEQVIYKHMCATLRWECETLRENRPNNNTVNANNMAAASLITKLDSAEGKIRELEQTISVQTKTIARLEKEQEPLRKQAFEAFEDFTKLAEEKDATEKKVKRLEHELEEVRTASIKGPGSTFGSSGFHHNQHHHSNNPSSMNTLRSLPSSSSLANTDKLHQELQSANETIQRLQRQLEEESHEHERKDMAIRDLSEELEEIQRRLDLLQHNSSSSDSVTKAEYEKQFDALEKQYRDQVRQMERKMAESEEKQRDNFAEREKSLEDALNREVFSSKQLEQRIQVLEKDRNLLEDKLKNTQQDLEVRHTGATESMKRKHLEELERLIEQHTNDRKNTEEKHDKEIEEIRLNSESEMKRMKQQLERSEYELVDQKRKFYQDQEELTEQVHSLTTRIKDLEESNAQLQQQVTKYEQEISQLTTASQETQVLRDELASLEKELQDEIFAKDTMKRDYERTLSNTKRENQDLLSKQEILKRQITTLDDELRTLNNRATSSFNDEEFKSLRNHYEETKSENDKIRQELAKQLKREEQFQLEYDGMLKEFDRLTRNFTDFESEKQKFEKKIAEAREENAKLQEQVHDLRTEQMSNLGNSGNNIGGSSGNDGGTTALRKEFRKMLMDVRQEYAVQLEKEVQEKNKIESQLRGLKRERDMEAYRKVNVGIQTSLII